MQSWKLLLKCFLQLWTLHCSTQPLCKEASAKTKHRDIMKCQIKELLQVDQKLSLSWNRSTGHFAVVFCVYCTSEKNYTIRRLLAGLVPFIHLHTENTWSHNTDLVPIYMYLRYSLNYTLSFIFEWLKQAKHVMTTEGSCVCFCNSSGNSS